MSDLILILETATESCSVALSCGNNIIAEKYINQPKAHASLLALYIKEILEENNISVRDCAAITVSKGPGSYTGLRVGVSCAKGLCYGAGKPLIAVDTLSCISQMAIDSMQNTLGANIPFLIVPMIDARRMEVYTATFNTKGEQISKTQALILDENSFREELEKGKVLFTGNGASKFRQLIEKNPNALFAEHLPHASGMRKYAYYSLVNKNFEDPAYFEPFYLKEFIAGKPKKLF